MEPYLGQIMIMAGQTVPKGWHLCDGTMLQIMQYQALFSLLGTSFGGNGTTTFALPDLRGRVVLGQGAGPNLTPHNVGATGGSEKVVLTGEHVTTHNHTIMASKANGTTNDPTGNAWCSNCPVDQYSVLASDSVLGTMDNGALSSSGGGQGHENMMPSLAVNFMIALTGVYPSRE